VLRTDKRRVERILVNLVENAFHHGSPPVWIELRHAAEVIEVTVTDSGPGIPPPHLAHIFDRFYKADPSRSTSRGSGLGLAIARENARLLGGDLKAENAPGGGARFVLSLPAS
jgi:two-component system sensor histidine kinase MtrB